MDINKEKIAHEKHLLSQGVDFKYLPNIQYNELENVYELIELGEEYSEALNEINSSWCTWQAAKAQAVPDGFIVIPTVFPESKAQILAEQEVETMSKRIDDKFRGGLEYSDEKKAHLVRMNVGERRQIFRDFFKMLDDLEQLNDSH